MIYKCFKCFSILAQVNEDDDEFLNYDLKCLNYKRDHDCLLKVDKCDNIVYYYFLYRDENNNRIIINNKDKMLFIFRNHSQILELKNPPSLLKFSMDGIPQVEDLINKIKVYVTFS